MASISITIGEPADLALVLENGDETKFPQVNIYEPSNATPIHTMDLDHAAEGMYRPDPAWTPGAVGHYHGIYTVYDDAARTVKSADFSKEMDHILVQLDLASMLQEIGDNVLELLGLREENIFMDLTKYDECCQLTSMRIRVFDTPAHADAATDGGSEVLGLIALYQITSNYEGAAKMLTYKKVRLV